MASAEVSSPARMFLSHAGADSEAARAIAALFRSAGVDVWLDVEQLHLGGLWQSDISNALASGGAPCTRRQSGLGVDEDVAKRAL
jgi:hypothetical protein